MRQREILVLFKSFNTLCICPSHYLVFDFQLKGLGSVEKSRYYLWRLPVQTHQHIYTLSMTTLVVTLLSSSVRGRAHPLWWGLEKEQEGGRGGGPYRSYRVLTPPPPQRSEGMQVEIIWTSKIPPSTPLGKASDIAKPDQIYVKN